MTDTFTLAVNGAAGRMGQRVIALARRDPALTLAAALEAEASDALGKDAEEIAGIGRVDVPVQSELGRRVDVVIDFSTPAGAVAISRVCAQRQIPLVVATTGLDPHQQQAVLSASQVTALLVSPSMSLAVNLAMKLVRDAAAVKVRTTAGSGRRCRGARRS